MVFSLTWRHSVWHYSQALYKQSKQAGSRIAAHCIGCERHSGCSQCRVVWSVLNVRYCNHVFVCSREKHSAIWCCVSLMSPWPSRTRTIFRFPWASCVHVIIGCLVVKSCEAEMLKWLQSVFMRVVFVQCVFGDLVTERGFKKLTAYSYWLN